MRRPRRGARGGRQAPHGARRHDRGEAGLGGLTHDAVAEAYREEFGRVVGALIAMTGDWDLAEDCAQEAVAIAVERWPAEGVPARPGAWLTTTARHRAIDRLRREARLPDRLAEAARGVPSAAPPADAELLADDDVPDERLALIFTCAHPALALEARVALTLRLVAGLTTAEIARAFLVPEATMAKRIVRAKAKIRHAGVAFRVPPRELLPQRTAGVLGVLYLLFNEGYSASAGDDVTRGALTAEAVRLARLLADLLPAEPEARALLALMLLQDARRAARQDAAGDLVPLDHQDRALWDARAIDEGRAILRSLPAEPRGPYRLQAEIAAQHAAARHARDTDWPAVAALYDELVALVPSAVVELNRAVAVAMADGPLAGLALADALAASGRLDGYHLLEATRADLLRRLGRGAAAAAAYERALALAPTAAERRFLAARRAELG